MNPALIHQMIELFWRAFAALQGLVTR